MTIPLPTRRPAPFQSVRTSRDLALVAFAVALFAAFVLQAGALVPRLAPAPGEPARVEQAHEQREPAVVARRAPAVVHRAAAADPAPAPAPAKAHAPCTAPRG